MLNETSFLPDPPTANVTSWFSFNTIIGAIDDIGLFAGWIEFAIDSNKPSDAEGIEKSSISLL